MQSTLSTHLPLQPQLIISPLILSVTVDSFWFRLVELVELAAVADEDADRLLVCARTLTVVRLVDVWKTGGLVRSQLQMFFIAFVFGTTFRHQRSSWTIWPSRTLVNILPIGSSRLAGKKRRALLMSFWNQPPCLVPTDIARSPSKTPGQIVSCAQWKNGDWRIWVEAQLV